MSHYVYYIELRNDLDSVVGIIGETFVEYSELPDMKLYFDTAIMAMKEDFCTHFVLKRAYDWQAPSKTRVQENLVTIGQAFVDALKFRGSGE